jgi:hypothetical protein
MYAHVRARLAAVAVVAGLLGACSPDSAVSSAPVDRPSSTVDASMRRRSTPVPAVALTRKHRLDRELYASVVADPKYGGRLELRQAGLEVEVPRGAVRERTRIWVKAYPGNLVAYEFGPHGTRFDVPLTARQDLKPTSWYKLIDKSRIEVGYFKHSSQIDPRSGIVLVDEFIPIDAFTRHNRAEFSIDHFSGYILSTGRTSTRTM